MSNEQIKLIAQFVSYAGLAFSTVALLLIALKSDQVMAWGVAVGFLVVGAICMGAGSWLLDKQR